MARATIWEGEREGSRRFGGKEDVDEYSAKAEEARENGSDQIYRLSHGKDFPGKSLSQSGRITDARGKWRGEGGRGWPRRERGKLLV